MIFFDTETCGFHGLAVLIQWAEDDGPIELYNVWSEPVSETLKLISKIANHKGGVCGFNLAFDWFHLCKLHTIWSLIPGDWYPEDHIEEIAMLEPDGRLGDCLKPVSACDLMLVARKGKYQSLMNRGDIKIRRVPRVLARPLAEELGNRVQLDGIYFAKRKDKYAPQWSVYDIDGKPDFQDVVLKFNSSTRLKDLAIHCGLADKVLKFDEISIEKKFMPEEHGFAPFARAIGKPGHWANTWPDVIWRHISHWGFNHLARTYAEDDVTYTRGLWKHLGSPEPGDDDSTLACMVGAVRWRGFKINVDMIEILKIKALKLSRSAPKSPSKVKAFLLPCLDETEKLALLDQQGKITTAKAYLESISRWKDDNGNPHKAAIRAKKVLDARKATKEVELYDKLIRSGRFHASFVVIGTLSSRMAGADGLNPQGINHRKDVRSCFPLADDGFILIGGDFEAQEITLADAVYDDPALRVAINTELDCDWCNPTAPNPKCAKCEGTGRWKQKIHALFAMELNPGMSYDDVIRSKATKDDWYLKGKSGVFAMVYGGDENTLKNKLAIDIDVALAAFTNFGIKYSGVARARRRTFNKFCSMRQPGGIGSNVEWHEPADYVESLFGFRRYFTLENRICKALYDLANHPPTVWQTFKIKVQRNQDREQTAYGALLSALYGAAFQIQAANMRAAANHEIQSSGAQVTKTLQRNIWDVQPSGVSEWLVVPMNVHDEVMVPTKPSYIERVSDIVRHTVDSFKSKVPLIAIDWKTHLSSWAGK